MRYYKFVMIVCMLLMLTFGEFAGIIRFRYEFTMMDMGGEILRKMTKISALVILCVSESSWFKAGRHCLSHSVVILCVSEGS